MADTMNCGEAADCGVRFWTRETAGSGMIGFASLARPRQLNALTLPMCSALLEQLRRWAADESIAAVLLCADGEKGFSAGGDVAAVVRSVRAGGPGRFILGDSFFEVEYSLDRLIHRYPKPLISHVHGICMGGGVGLAVGARHRVIGDSARVAMPEIHIGLFPDVGGGWFLNRVPAGIGRIMALTGMIINEADALFAGLADVFVPNEQREALWDDLCALELIASPARDDAAIAALLLAAHRRYKVGLPLSRLQQYLDALRFIAAQPDLNGLLATLQAAAAEDPWFEAPAASLAGGSPTTAVITDEYLRRTRLMGLDQVLALDLVMARQFQRHHDFLEGVRALLIDKDRKPAWEASTFDAVDPQRVRRHFEPLH
ncbi:MAG: enoyl-CoA hydratase/isomerase family protein [Burkholderiaceae bacterium]